MRRTSSVHRPARRAARRERRAPPLRRPPRRRRPADRPGARRRLPRRRSPPTPRRCSRPRTSSRVERVDAVASGEELGLALAEELARLAPFGAGNPEVSLLLARGDVQRPVRVRRRAPRPARALHGRSGGGARARGRFGGGARPPSSPASPSTPRSASRSTSGGAPSSRGWSLRQASACAPPPIVRLGEDGVPRARAHVRRSDPQGARSASGEPAPGARPARPRHRRDDRRARRRPGEPVLVLCADGLAAAAPLAERGSAGSRWRRTPRSSAPRRAGRCLPPSRPARPARRTRRSAQRCASSARATR